jgi:tetratricopeptide (TPR) repeat protein
LTTLGGGTTLDRVVSGLMRIFEQRTQLLLLTLCMLFLQWRAVSQDRSSDEGALRGDRGEISVTVRNESGQIISTPATVKLYHSGVLSGQAATSRGRAFFILDKLGDYVITAEAAGYRTAQKDVSVRVAINDEEDLVLHRESGGEVNPAVPGTPLLAPKAREALEKGLAALNEDKLDQAEEHLDEAMKLAPSHPDVLYVRGVIYLRQHQWAKAQTVLEKATQLGPKQARAFSALGMALVDAGKYDQAIAPLQRSLQLGPMGWETHWALAKAYYHHAQYDDALKQSQEALAESHGAAPEVSLLVAQSLTAVGRYEDSAQTLREFLKQHPDAPGAATARRWLERLATDGKIHRD